MKRAFVLALLLVACSPASRGPDDTSSAALMRNLLRAPTIEFVVPSAQPIGAACGRAFARIAYTLGPERSVAVRWVPPDTAGDPNAARVVVGGPADPLARSLAARLGLVFGEEAGKPSFAFGGQTFAGPLDAVIAVFADPDRRGLPLTLVYGNDRDGLAGYVGDLEPGWKPWVRMYAAGDLALSGPLAASGAIVERKLDHPSVRRARWMLDSVPLPADDPLVTGAAARDLDPDRLKAYLADVSLARTRISAWAGGGAPLAPLVLFVHGRPESLEVSTGASALSAVNPVSGVVHAVVCGSLPDDAGLGAARALARATLGTPPRMGPVDGGALVYWPQPDSSGWMDDGAALDAAGRWWGRDLDEWIAWLRAGGLVPRVAVLVNPDADADLSAHVLLPARAALFRFLMAAHDAAWMRRLWKGEESLAVDEALEKRFATWLDEARAWSRPAERAGRRSALFQAGPLKGVGIEEPADGYAKPERGFGSRACEQSLDEARALGANAVALSCFAVNELDPPAAPDPWRRRSIAPREGDLRLFATLLAARERGMRTLLQPHLLATPTGSLAGAGAQGGRAGWEHFFARGEANLIHLGLLAELAGCDGLSLGGDLAAATRLSDQGRRTQPESAQWRIDGWARVIRSVRAAFAGTLTYSAGSLLEAQQLFFWDDLDAVAGDVNEELNDKGLAVKDDPETDLESRLLTQVAELGKIAAAHGKPLLVGSVGFGPAPHVSRLRKPENLAGGTTLQALELDVLGRALARAGPENGLRGVFLWRWSTDPRDEGVNARDGLVRSREARQAAARALSKF